MLARFSYRSWDNHLATVAQQMGVAVPLCVVAVLGPDLHDLRLPGHEVVAMTAITRRLGQVIVVARQTPVLRLARDLHFVEDLVRDLWQGHRVRRRAVASIVGLHVDGVRHVALVIG